MNLSQIHRFIRKINNGNDISVGWYWSKKNKWYRYPAHATLNRGIFFHRDKWYRKSTINQKLLLFHEVGHYHIRPPYSKSKNEFKAHRWAINKSKRLGMKKIHSDLKKEMRGWLKFKKHGFYSWQHCRGYILAARMAKEGGII